MQCTGINLCNVTLLAELVNLQNLCFDTIIYLVS